MLRLKAWYRIETRGGGRVIGQGRTVPHREHEPCSPDENSKLTAQHDADSLRRWPRVALLKKDSSNDGVGPLLCRWRGDCGTQLLYSSVCFYPGDLAVLMKTGAGEKSGSRQIYWQYGTNKSGPVPRAYWSFTATVFQNREGNLSGGGGPGDTLEIGPPVTPKSGVVGKRALQHRHDRFGRFREGTRFIAADEFIISLLLPGHNLADEQGAERVD